MRHILLSFTLKNQKQEEILDALAKVYTKHRGAILLHGFMPKKELMAKGIDTTIVDALHTYFPKQINFYCDGKPLRYLMAEAAMQLGATIIVIGNIVDGVKEEFDLYQSNEMIVTQLSLIKRVPPVRHYKGDKAARKRPYQTTMKASFLESNKTK